MAGRSMRKMVFPLIIALSLSLIHAYSGFAETILSEGFESGVLGEGWEKNTDDTLRLAFERRPEYVHSGKASYRVSIQNLDGKAMGSNIKFFFLPGVDKAHFRWYGKFSDEMKTGLSHYVFITGSRMDNKYSPLGQAGNAADGTNFFVTNLEPSTHRGKYPPPGIMGFYTYWPDMKPDPRSGKYWGNRFEPDEPFQLETGRWYCFEAMIKLNEPGKRDGEQAFWVDGKNLLHMTDMRWRESDILRLNMLNLELYYGHPEHDMSVWFDDVVIDTDYIGPMD